jgi:outer membrane lipoprotein-sorting protein
MKRLITVMVRILALLALVWLPGSVQALTAKEILEKAARESLGESFRVVLTVKSFKGNKPIAQHAVWLMGSMEGETARFFMEFDEPEESKGLRFFMIITKEGQPQAFMYLPATKRTIPLAADDPSVDLGGSGLTTEDVRLFVPKVGEKQTLEGEEKVGERECYKIKVMAPQDSAERLIWVTKKDFMVVKSVNVDSKGKVDRSLRVVEFFKTEKGKEFPREEEILIPAKGVRIQLRQEHAVFGVTIPDELLDPTTFGAYKWRN